MKWYLASCLVVVVVFMVWHRRPAGRQTFGPSNDESDPQNIKGMIDFDEANPNASEEQRATFYRAVLAQLDGDNDVARDEYSRIRLENPDEPTTTHNIRLINIFKRK